LTPKGVSIGLVGAERRSLFEDKMAAFAEAERELKALRLSPATAAKQGFQVKQDGVVRDGLALLGLPDIDVPALATVCPSLAGLRRDVAEQFEIEARYAGYLSRQLADITAFRREEAFEIPVDLDLDGIAGMSREVRERLMEVRPETLGSAARIPGMTPAALALLYKHAKRNVSA
jgi:tRNA uridine 5-carboxymethylaminomethyl modification enzyme